ncbi:LysR substrate-binding domain-containing protein [Achromobacter aloeverae]
MNHREVEVFRAVMQTGSATAAAGLLHTSQSAISKVIAQMQRRSRVKLFELRRSRLVPTPEATVLYRSVVRSYVGLDLVRQTLDELRTGGTGRIAIGAAPSFAMGALPRIVRAYTVNNPNVKLSLQTINSSLVKDGVVSGTLDMGVALKDIDVAGVESRTLLKTNLVCVMSAEHPLAEREDISIGDLARFPYLAPSRDSASRALSDAPFVASGIVPNVVVETTYAVNICFLALQGVGVGLVNPLIAAEFAPLGLQVRRLVPEQPIEMLLLLPSSRPPSLLAQKLIQEIEDFFAGAAKRLK